MLLKFTFTSHFYEMIWTVESLASNALYDARRRVQAFVRNKPLSESFMQAAVA